ncbi:MAG: amidohydrolase, partial [Planctomycetota bacterium]
MIDQTALRPSHSDGPSGGGRANAPLPASLDAAVEAHRERLVRFRRLLHATPEASNQERATTARVAEALREAGLEPRIMADDTGVCVDLDLGAPADSLIALRSELDCVQVNDDKQVPYASTRPGLCHAC